MGDVLVYDGDCAFCTTSARWMQHRLPAGTAVTPWQQLDLDAVGLTRAQVDAAAWWLDDRGHAYGGHLAIGHALLASRRGRWRALGALIVTPPLRWLAAPAYAWVAANRDKMPGATDACAVTAPRTVNVSPPDAQAQTASPTRRNPSAGSSTSPVTNGPKSA